MANPFFVFQSHSEKANCETDTIMYNKKTELKESC